MILVTPNFLFCLHVLVQIHTMTGFWFGFVQYLRFFYHVNNIMQFGKIPSSVYFNVYETLVQKTEVRFNLR